MESIIELRKKTGVLVAAHRGTSGGNIPPNSIAAFDIANSCVRNEYRFVLYYMASYFVYRHPEFMEKLE